MTTYKIVDIPRPNGLAVYHTLLRSEVFPATDALDAEGLIEGFDFINHEFLELRLWIPANGDETRIREVLTNHSLPTDMRDGAPSETGQDRTHFLEVMFRNVEQIQLLVEPGQARNIEEVVHWFLNQWGFSNEIEIAWHKDQARAVARMIGR